VGVAERRRWWFSNSISKLVYIGQGKMGCAGSMTSAALDPAPLPPPHTSALSFLNAGLLRFTLFCSASLNKYTTATDNVVTALRSPPNRISYFTGVHERY